MTANPRVGSVVPEKLLVAVLVGLGTDLGFLVGHWVTCVVGKGDLRRRPGPANYLGRDRCHSCAHPVTLPHTPISGR